MNGAQVSPICVYLGLSALLSDSMFKPGLCSGKPLCPQLVQMVVGIHAVKYCTLQCINRGLLPSTASVNSLSQATTAFKAANKLLLNCFNVVGVSIVGFVLTNTFSVYAIIT